MALSALARPVPAEGSGEGFYGQDVLAVPLAAEFADEGDQGDEERADDGDGQFHVELEGVEDQDR